MALKASREECWHWLIQFLNGKEHNISVSLSQTVLIRLQKKKILWTKNILHWVGKLDQFSLNYLASVYMSHLMFVGLCTTAEESCRREGLESTVDCSFQRHLSLKFVYLSQRVQGKALKNSASWSTAIFIWHEFIYSGYNTGTITKKELITKVYGVVVLIGSQFIKIIANRRGKLFRKYYLISPPCNLSPIYPAIYHYLFVIDPKRKKDKRS